MTIKGVLFDLDGTLLDTAGDLAKALNQIRLDQGLPTLDKNIIRSAAGQGAKGLLKLGFEMDETSEEFAKYSQKLFSYYQDCLADTTQLFQGMENVLLHLANENIPWGIVTNKPARFTDPLVKRLNLLAHCVISGDTLAQRKPHPAPILHACEILKIAPEMCLFVGDSEIDIIASKAAGCTSLAALYGYIPTEELAENWHADGYIHTPEEIISWL